jgi:hypothetical protein
MTLHNQLDYFVQTQIPTEKTPWEHLSLNFHGLAHWQITTISMYCSDVMVQFGLGLSKISQTVNWTLGSGSLWFQPWTEPKQFNKVPFSHFIGPRRYSMTIGMIFYVWSHNRTYEITYILICNISTVLKVIWSWGLQNRCWGHCSAFDIHQVYLTFWFCKISVENATFGSILGQTYCQICSGSVPFEPVRLFKPGSDKVLLAWTLNWTLCSIQAWGQLWTKLWFGSQKFRFKPNSLTGIGIPTSDTLVVLPAVNYHNWMDGFFNLVWEE